MVTLEVTPPYPEVLAYTEFADSAKNKRFDGEHWHETRKAWIARILA
jgi:hypothetical protein